MKFIKTITLFISVSSIFIYIIFVNSYFNETINNFTREFKKQNVLELSRGDIFALSTRLNNLSKVIPWKCIIAKNDSNVFLEKKISPSSCQETSSFFTRTVIIKNNIGPSIEILFKLSIPMFIQQISFIFIISNFILLLLLFIFSRYMGRRKDMHQLSVHGRRSSVYASEVRRPRSKKQTRSSKQ